jgi:hypothetical protein
MDSQPPESKVKVSKRSYGVGIWPRGLTLRSCDVCGKGRDNDGQSSNGSGSELHVDDCGDTFRFDGCWFGLVLVFGRWLY